MDAHTQSQLLQKLIRVNLSSQRLNLSLLNADREQILISYNLMLKEMSHVGEALASALNFEARRA
ncbi:hypothetical protein [Succinatimonas hippei]|uniref:hypothetical protein n=1 Tax=Succinatimonas hippei TaxID=626938 RepID=UPI0023F66312|nr:hypothetical protein [Succinatimonas hippei]